MFGFVEEGFAFGRVAEIEVEEAVSLACFKDFAALERSLLSLSEEMRAIGAVGKSSGNGGRLSSDDFTPTIVSVCVGFKDGKEIFELDCRSW